MYTVRVQSHFSSAHNLRGYKGKCEDLHGHNWRVETEVSSEKLDDIGMVVDFKELKKSLSDIVSGLDHKYLNDVEEFKQDNPTSENIARYISGCMSAKHPDLKVRSVTVWETETSSATYSE
ncbi:MAG: 6-carboxytetrahydropterin synthase QueD [Candidatus Aadella gelida]|nr:6-carboxytetrahydropterin synthase QueD [Candidatus Aadella gelida]